MRRRQFIQLIYDLRAEIGRSVDPAAGVSDLPQLKRTIQRNYETLYDAYDWPFLTVTASVALGAGQRLYDFPSEIDSDKIEEIRLFWNDQPVSIERGISLDDFATYDSEADERADPVLKWDVRYHANKEELEVWPIPASTGDSIRFKGKKKFVQLVNDADVCLLDDHIVVLFSAVELLGEKASQTLKTKFAAAQARLGSVKGRSKNEDGRIRVGLGSAQPRPSHRSVVRVSG